MKLDAMAKFDLWMEKIEDKDLINDLIAISNDKTEIENRFYKDLEFGTGGMRGILGAGTNCMNIYTVMRATQGLADYMKSISSKSIAIGYDSRIKSNIFAECAAQIMAENGFTVYLTSEIVPTPFISFLVRHYKCDMGIMITASHNPAKYNGYKVSGSDGCQATDDVSNLITDFISKVEMFGRKVLPIEKYKTIVKVPESVIDLYIEKVYEQSLNLPENIVIAYTPLNGAGYKIIPKIFSKIGLKSNDVIIVKEQGFPDGNFTTCPYPNPEKPEALKLGLEYAKKSGADILIATDPDADRVGTAVLHKGEYRLISGNEMGALLTNYIFSCRKKLGTLPKNPVLIKTIVSTALADKIAKDFNATVIDVLTGFKYIGEQITLLEKAGEVERFVFGFEESYGYLCGAHVRDKDAQVTRML
ncbi:MAG: phospho-sugar mutase, partial [Firmicutes bacterium]|nr:phospho-sugar mutase [Bacillota bacterium]